MAATWPFLEKNIPPYWIYSHSKVSKGWLTNVLGLTSVKQQEIIHCVSEASLGIVALVTPKDDDVTKVNHRGMIVPWGGDISYPKLLWFQPLPVCQI